ncbi:hypothetical protein [Sphaerisporangium fuscum]|uniref:hypothetical protein n=1 Tax=Sphaerisporangium fuscum TaxID=2835868 RepID=UPI001BDC4D8C|nr:hypothetical protein [Sphaerisporangium fuscum]
MILGLDAGSRTVTEAEHLLHHAVKALGLPPSAVGCTHFVRTATSAPHVACSLTVEETTVSDVVAALGEAGVTEAGVALGDGRGGPGELAEGAALAAAEHAAGAGGRLVVYPGVSEMTGTLTVAELLALGSVDRVAVLAQAEDPSPGTPITTNEHVRPQWRGGRVVLLTMPASGGRLMPAEVPNPTPCCEDHA